MHIDDYISCYENCQISFDKRYGTSHKKYYLGINTLIIKTDRSFNFEALKDTIMLIMKLDDLDDTYIVRQTTYPDNLYRVKVFKPGKVVSKSTRSKASAEAIKRLIQDSYPDITVSISKQPKTGMWVTDNLLKLPQEAEVILGIRTYKTTKQLLKENLNYEGSITRLNEITTEHKKPRRESVVRQEFADFLAKLHTKLELDLYNETNIDYLTKLRLDANPTIHSRKLLVEEE